MAELKAALFDIDGTLIDSNDLNVAAWFDAFQEADIAIAREATHGQIGKGGDNLLPALAPQCDEAMQKGLQTRQGEIFKADYIARAKLFPHARALLERVRETGAKVVLASSAAREQLDHYIGLMDARTLSGAIAVYRDAADLLAHFDQSPLAA